MMRVTEFLNGESLTGRQAATIFFLWLGLVLAAGFVLVFNTSYILYSSDNIFWQSEPEINQLSRV